MRIGDGGTNPQFSEGEYFAYLSLCNPQNALAILYPPAAAITEINLQPTKFERQSRPFSHYRTT